MGYFNCSGYMLITLDKPDIFEVAKDFLGFALKKNEQKSKNPNETAVRPSIGCDVM